MEIHSNPFTFATFCFCGFSIWDGIYFIGWQGPLHVQEPIKSLAMWLSKYGISNWQPRLSGNRANELNESQRMDLKKCLKDNSHNIELWVADRREKVKISSYLPESFSKMSSLV